MSQLITVAPNSQSPPLLATNLGFNIKPGLVAAGFEVTVLGSQSSEATGVSLNIQAVGGTEVNNFVLPTASGSVLIGSATDLWGNEDWTSKELNSPNFGFGIVAINNSGAAVTFEIDGLSVIAFYAYPGPAKLVVCPLCRWIQSIYYPRKLIMDTSITPLIYG